MPSLTREQIAECSRRHGAAEQAMDLEATMATVAPDSLIEVWEFHPLGLAFTGRQAVQAQYEILFEHILPHAVSHTERCRAFGDRYVMQEQLFHFNFEGRESESQFTVVVTCDAEARYVTSERGYVSGSLVPALERYFGDTFRALPGVYDVFPRS